MHLKPLLSLTLICLALPVFAQQKQPPCRDVLVLRDGSVYRGTITAYQHDGELEMTTWSGGKITVASKNVRKVKQQCSDEANSVAARAKGGFREKGWYNAPRLATYWADQQSGVGLQYSTGMQFNRMLGAGIGVGIEKLSDYYSYDVASFPIFAEARGYLTDKNIAPFYALGYGWALTRKGEDGDFEGSIDQWKGGLLSQWQIGLRIGDFFTVHTGLRFQRKTRSWSRWWGTQGEDRIFQKRFEFGLGIVF